MSILSTLKTDAEATLAAFLGKFITDDVGKLAVDAVNYAARNVDGSGADKRDAAKTQLLNDAAAAGQDLASEGDAALNFLIETALQAVSAGIVAAI